MLQSPNKQEVKEKIKEEIQSLNKQEVKEIQKYIEQLSTDEASNEHSFEKAIPHINEEYLKKDEYGNTLLSHIIEEGKIEEVRKAYILEKSLSDANLLRTIAVDMMDEKVQKEYNLTKDVCFTIYSEAKYQLNLMGEDIDTVIEAYTI